MIEFMKLSSVALYSSYFNQLWMHFDLLFILTATATATQKKKKTELSELNNSGPESKILIYNNVQLLIVSVQIMS